jgi:Coenzyme PQQ synthesis protein D (PqqD)
MVAVDDIPTPTTACVARRQSSAYLFYNSRTDEMHLVPPTGFYVFQLCDGCNSVGDIESILGCNLGVDPKDLTTAVRNFLGDLVDRGILELANAQ